jgi:hypothetical protein
VTNHEASHAAIWSPASRVKIGTKRSEVNDGRGAGPFAPVLRLFGSRADAARGMFGAVREPDRAPRR